MNILWLDYETKSECNLLDRGAYNYACDASTEILCLSYAFNDEDVLTWTPDQPFPIRIANHFASNFQIRAHNCGFDRLITEYVLCNDFNIPKPALEAWYCTATQARANCLPASLEDIGRALSSNMRKDHRGKQLIRLMCIPPFSTDPKLMAEMIEYCEMDVKVMRTISGAMRQLSDDELADYHVSERINDRGILIDVPLAKSAIQYASAELEEIQALVADITQGEITSVRSPKMRQWVQDRVGEEALKLMWNGEKYSIDKTVRANLLALAEENPDEVPNEVADVIQSADDLWASSVAKFNRLSQLADEEDDRLRGAFVFAGGSATGRAASYGAQIHNLTRKCAKDPAEVRQAMVRGHAIVPKFGRRITDVLKGMLRPAIIPAEGKSLVVADWAAIEARCNPWLSNDKRADEVLDVFRSGRDIYIREAAAIFHVPEAEVGKDKRQIGKVAILACGFGGGLGAFGAMSRAYGLNLAESDARRTVDAWRRANQWAVNYWQKLEEAYTRAMRNKGKEFSAGRVTYLFDGNHLWYALPSGRVLSYPYAKLDLDGVTYAKASWKPSADAKEWPRARLWKGLACENITQAVANDILRHSLRQLDDVILHCHDEIVIETSNPDAISEQLKRVMCTPPDWAKGLPLDVEVSVMLRYGK